MCGGARGDAGAGRSAQGRASPAARRRGPAHARLTPRGSPERGSLFLFGACRRPTPRGHDGAKGEESERSRRHAPFRVCSDSHRVSAHAVGMLRDFFKKDTLGRVVRRPRVRPRWARRGAIAARRARAQPRQVRRRRGRALSFVPALEQPLGSVDEPAPCRRQRDALCWLLRAGARRAQRAVVVAVGQRPLDAGELLLDELVPISLRPI